MCRVTEAGSRVSMNVSVGGFGTAGVSAMAWSGAGVNPAGGEVSTTQ